DLELSVDGAKAQGVSAFFQSGPRYTFFGNKPLHLASGCELDDGTLGGAILCRAKRRDVPAAVGRLLSRRLDVGGHRHIEVFTGATAIDVKASCGRAFPLAVDGDYIGEATEARVTIRQGQLSVLL